IHKPAAAASERFFAPAAPAMVRAPQFGMRGTDRARGQDGRAEPGGSASLSSGPPQPKSAESAAIRPSLASDTSSPEQSPNQSPGGPSPWRGRPDAVDGSVAECG